MIKILRKKFYAILNFILVSWFDGNLLRLLHVLLIFIFRIFIKKIKVKLNLTFSEFFYDLNLSSGYQDNRKIFSLCNLVCRNVWRFIALLFQFEDKKKVIFCLNVFKNVLKIKLLVAFVFLEDVSLSIFMSTVRQSNDLNL